MKRLTRAAASSRPRSALVGGSRAARAASGLPHRRPERPLARIARAALPTRRPAARFGPLSLPRGKSRAARAAYDIRYGRLERSLALLTAAGSAITAAEIYLEHDRAGFGNRVMWWPVLLGPVGVAAGVAGFASERAAHTALPVASAAITANGLQGTYLHVRGIAQKPGGWRMARYNIELGPPLFAPLLMSMVGGMGLLASVLRREK